MKTIKTLLAASALASITGAANATIWQFEMNASIYFPAASGPLNMTGFSGEWDDYTGYGYWDGTTIIPGFNTTMHYTQTFFMPRTDMVANPDGNGNDTWSAGYGYLAPLEIASCTDNTGSACAGLQSPLSGYMFNTNGTNLSDYQTPVGFNPMDGWTGTWTLQVYKYINQNTTEYIPMPMNVQFSCMDCEPNPNPDPVVTPIPGAAWFLGSGLIGLIGMSRRKLT